MMAIWNISTLRNGVSLKYLNSAGIEFNLNKNNELSQSPLQKVLAWVAQEMDQGDIATIDGQIRMQKFTATVE